MFAGMAAFGRRLRGRGEKLLWQPREVFRLLEDKEEVLFVREHVLSERGAERRQPLADLGEPRLLVRRQARAGPHEGEAIALDQSNRLGIEAAAFPARIDRVDPLKQSIVEIDRVALACENRRDLALDRLDLVVGVGADQVKEHGGDAVEHAARALHRENRVLEAGGFGIGFDRRDLARAFSSIAAVNAGRKCSTRTAANGGESNGPVQGRSSGFSGRAESVSKGAPRGAVGIVGMGSISTVLRQPAADRALRPRTAPSVLSVIASKAKQSICPQNTPSTLSPRRSRNHSVRDFRRQRTRRSEFFDSSPAEPWIVSLRSQ